MIVRRSRSSSRSFCSAALAALDVSMDPIEADERAFLIVDRRHRDVEPAILSVEAANARLRRAVLLAFLHTPPPRSELLDLVGMDGGLPLRSVQLVRRKPGVI